MIKTAQVPVSLLYDECLKLLQRLLETLYLFVFVIDLLLERA